MSANFEIVGKLKAVKETENFKAWEVRDFKSGWQNTRYRFNVISDNNRFMLEIGGGKWTDDKKNRILTFTKAEPGKKAEKLEVKWENRKDPDVISKVAGFRVYTCNLLTFDERKELEESGDVETANKKNHQFLEATEYAALVKRVIDSEKYADSKFKILGTVDYQYSEKNNQFYRTLTVNKMYKVADDTPCKAEMNVDAYYTEDSLDSDAYGENKKCLFNCYTDYYFSSIKEKRFVPLTLVLKSDGGEKDEKRVAGFMKKLQQFDDDATVRKVSLICDMIDGAESKAITMADLDDETRELIELGMMDEDEAIRALGGSMNGETVKETRISKLGRASVKGTEPTAYEEADLHRLPVIDAVDNEEEPVDLFSEDEDEDDI